MSLSFVESEGLCGAELQSTKSKLVCAKCTLEAKVGVTN